MTATISIFLKSFEKISSSREEKETLAIGLPTRRILYTLIRSPHIDKKSREQFEMKIYKKLIRIRTENHKLYEKLSNCKLHDISGVQMKVTFSYKTRWNPIPHTLVSPSSQSKKNYNL